MTKISQKLTKKGADTFLLGHKTYSMTANCMCQHNYQVKCKKKCKVTFHAKDGDHTLDENNIREQLEQLKI